MNERWDDTINWSPFLRPRSCVSNCGDAFENMSRFMSFHLYDLSLIKIKNTHLQNSSRGERKALKDLSKNRDIVIKPADKGSAVVVTNTSDYIKEGERQLKDEKFYRKLD